MSEASMLVIVGAYPADRPTVSIVSIAVRAGQAGHPVGLDEAAVAPEACEVTSAPSAAVRGVVPSALSSPARTAGGASGTGPTAAGWYRRRS
jgi:hypothetical protein